MAITFKTRIGLLKHLPGMHYVEIPKAIIEKLGGKFKKRVHCKVKGTAKAITFQGGLVALGGGKGYISLSKKRMQDAGLKLGAIASVTLTPDKSRFGMPVPEELAELLKQDDEGRRRFEGLTMGKQRYVVFYVGQVKNSDKRLERAIMLIENLKTAPVGKETFRHMLGLGKKEF